LAFAAARLAEANRTTGGAITLAEVPYLAQVNLRLDPKGPAADAVAVELGVPLPTEAGTSARSGGLTLAWLGPDEWLVLGPPDTEGELQGRLRSAVGSAHASVVDVSAQRTTLLVAGPQARDLLALGCTLDLHPRSFGEGGCAQTMLARAQVVLLRRDPADGNAGAADSKSGADSNAGAADSNAGATNSTGAPGPAPGDADTFWVLVRASVAAYMVDWLIDASVEFSAAPA
jgi:sarcosine oxidase subunit gamma